MTPGTSTLRRIAERLDAERLEARADEWERAGTRKGARQAWHLRQIAAAHRRKAERAEGET